MAITEYGFNRRTYDDILNDKIAKAVELFGSDIDTSEKTPLGKFIRINAYDTAIAEEEIETLYYSMSPDTATGNALDRFSCPFVGISRLQATAARYSVEVTGTAGTEIPYGFLVSTESKITYYNTNATTIGESGKVTITVDCETLGVIGNVSPQEIKEVVNPIGDVTVIGVELINAGTDTEDDVALRKRFEQARDGLGSCNANAIRAALLRVPTVISAGVIENDTDNTDSSGRPAHSFECYVAGGENYHDQIAEAIFSKKPIGVKTHGSQSVDIVDESGTTRTIKFSHTENVTVYVQISIKTNVNFEGENGIEQIKNNIQSYINSLGVGESVIVSSLYGKIHAVSGVADVTVLQLSTDGTTWQSSNIDISKWQKAQCTSVTVTEVT